ncbi:hypothetical protein [Mesobacillus zeae]|uniref:hypothetical protein n=1 Tax=Mesobacillus zeae TaxID=1917180 RepID=UPI00300BC772
MNAKITVPAEVAEALGLYVGATKSKTEAFMSIRNDGDIYKQSSVIRSYFKSNIDGILEALVNGYTVEQTPEEKVREYWSKLMSDRYNVNDEHHLDKLSAEIHGIIKTLNLLGIKIEGVND